MSQNPQIEALKPCPFCGREPELYTVSNGDGAELEFVFRCEECGVEKSAEWKHEAVAVWNRRASQEAAAPSEEPVATGEAYWLRKNAVLVRELGSSMSPGALAAAMERRADALVASPAVAPVAVSVKAWEDRYRRQVVYSCDLQRIIEDLCKRRDIRMPETTARFHYDMAVAYRASIIPATKGGEDDLGMVYAPHVTSALAAAHEAVTNAEIEAERLRVALRKIADFSPGSRVQPALIARAALSAQDTDATGTVVGTERATNISMGHGLVDVTEIHWQGRDGILFRPREKVIPIGEPGELDAGDYYPVEGDVVIWIDNPSGAEVIAKVLKPFLSAQDTDGVAK